MPATSAKQKKFMDAVAHNPKFAKASGVPVSVGKDFSEASKGMKFGKGAPASRPDIQKINQPKTLHGDMAVMKGGGMATKKMFGGKESFKEELTEAKAIKSGKITPQQYARGEKSEGVHSMKKMANGGITKAKMGAVKTAAPSRDGVATKGKTKGTMIVMKAAGKPLGMKRGGKAC